MNESVTISGITVKKSDLKELFYALTDATTAKCLSGNSIIKIEENDKKNTELSGTQCYSMLFCHGKTKSKTSELYSMVLFFMCFFLHGKT